MKAKTDLIEQRQQNLREIIKRGHDPYPHRFELTHTVSELVRDFGLKSAEELEKEPRSIQTAGRLMNLREHGKAAFADILGQAERIQVYVRRDRVGEDNFNLFRLFDLGDAVGVRGTMFRTRTGELTILAEKVEFLAKALLPLPEKWHGLADVEVRYRQRYLDLIANPAARAVFARRSRIISELRRFLDSRGYLEVETPMMQPVAGGAVARPFKTYHEALNIPLFLRIAPELYLKRLIVGGFDRVYEINRNFRNEGISTQHNPEFTMLEFYQAYSDYRDLMHLTEEMMLTLVQNVTGEDAVEFGSKRINFKKMRRLSLLDAIREFWPAEKAPSRPSRDELCDRDAVLKLLLNLGGEPAESATWGKMVGILFETLAEAKLIQPTIVFDFPAELSPLSKRKDEDPRFAERFEMYVGGMEVANAYSELNDPEEQELRFREQLEARAHGDEEAHAMDRDYVRALRYGMPPTAGEGIGIDRLTMVLTNSASIREVILFPHLRPEE